MKLPVLAALLLGAFNAVATAQEPVAPTPAGAAAPPVAAPGMPESLPPDMPVTGFAPGVALADYTIGPGDALSIVYWRDREMSADVVVRPDGKITLPVLNEVEVANQTPEQLREKLTELARKYVTDPRLSVVVRQIRSRYCFITGRIGRPGPYPLYGPMSVLQLIAMAGGLQDYADKSNIVVVRSENGQQVRHRFNYKEVIGGGSLAQNITLRPGDTVVVP